MNDLERTVFEFLRKYGNLENDNKPILKRELDEYELHIKQTIHPKFWLEYDISQDQDYENKAWERKFLLDYSKINLKNMLVENFENLIFKDIPDSNEYALIDVGSHLGQRITLNFALQKPNVEVILIDKISENDLTREIKNNKYIKSNTAPSSWNSFNLKFNNNFDGDVSNYLNNTFLENNLKNVTYHESLIDSTFAHNPIQLRDKLKHKKITVIGYKNPKGLGNLTINLANSLNANNLYLTNSALEKISPDDAIFTHMKNYLLKKDITTQEVKKIVSLIYFEFHENLKINKYDYHNHMEKIFGDTIKLPFILSQQDMLNKSGFDSEIIRLVYENKPVNYNNPSQGIKAIRK